MISMIAAGQDDTVAAVKAVRQAFETISLPAVIDLVPGGIDKGVYAVVHFASCPLNRRIVAGLAPLVGHVPDFSHTQM